MQRRSRAARCPAPHLSRYPTGIPTSAANGAALKAGVHGRTLTVEGSFRKQCINIPQWALTKLKRLICDSLILSNLFMLFGCEQALVQKAGYHLVISLLLPSSYLVLVGLWLEGHCGGVLDMVAGGEDRSFDFFGN